MSPSRPTPGPESTDREGPESGQAGSSALAAISLAHGSPNAASAARSACRGSSPTPMSGSSATIATASQRPSFSVSVTSTGKRGRSGGVADDGPSPTRRSSGHDEAPLVSGTLGSPAVAG